MRIVQLIQRRQLRGAEMFATQIAHIHRQQGHEVLVLALFATDYAAVLDTGDLPLEQLALAETRRLYDLKGWAKLARRIRAFRPDIVQANAGDTLKYAIFSRLFFGWPGKLVLRNANQLSFFVGGRGKQLFLNGLLSQVDGIVSVSDLCAQDLTLLFPSLKDQTVAIPIGTPRDAGPTRRREEVLRDLEIPIDEPLFINVGSFVPEKNHAGLLRIFAALRQQLGRGHLLLVGDGHLRVALEEQCIDLRLLTEVSFAGYRQDVSELLHHADVMIMPSLIEGLPGVILEAMARRLPVVAADVGGIGEVIQNGKTGYLIPPNEEQQFVIKTLALLAHTELRDTLTESAYQLVAAQLTIDRIADKFLGYYQMLLLSDPNPSRYKIPRPRWRRNATARDATRTQPG